MAKRRISEINGMFIYHDDKNRTIYWDIFTQKGYYLINEDVTKFMLDKFTLPIMGLLAYLLIQFKVKPLISIGIAFGLYLICKILWRVLFLYKHTIIKSFNKGTLKDRFNELLKNYSRTKLILLVILCVALIVVMTYSIFAYELEKVYFILFIALDALALIIIILSLIGIKFNAK